jgi:nicotinamide-nucleotide amidase
VTTLYAEILAIGSELLLGGRTETNSLFLADQLAALGIPVRFKTVVGDHEEDIRQALQVAVSRAALVVMTGGLGPTTDDRTREAVAALTKRPLRRRPEAMNSMMQRLAQWGRTASPAQLRQARIPTGAVVLNNPVGSAPGFWVEWKRAVLVALPGVPIEAEQMFFHEVLPRLRQRYAEEPRSVLRPVTRHTFQTFGLPESEVEQRLEGVFKAGHKGIGLGLLASPRGVQVSLTGKGEMPQALLDAVRQRLRDWLFAEQDQTMEEVIGRLLTEHRLTLAVAESCTGGLIGHRLTQVAGSSAYLDRVVVCYSNQSKVELLSVPEQLIAQHGAVSEPVAAAMANGIRERSGTDLGLSVTGIAGPGGATETKPVGLVYVGLDGGAGEPVTKEFRFHGERDTIKQRASQAALDLLRRWLIGRNSR